MPPALRSAPPFILIAIPWLVCALQLQRVEAQQPPLPEPGAFTAAELIEKANAAFAGGDFQTAEVLFLGFERDFGEEEEVKDVVLKNKALIALCKITNGRVLQWIGLCCGDWNKPGCGRTHRRTSGH